MRDQLIQFIQLKGGVYAPTWNPERIDYVIKTEKDLENAATKKAKEADLHLMDLEQFQSFLREILNQPDFRIDNIYFIESKRCRGSPINSARK